jgi:hypothetical protein
MVEMIFKFIFAGHDIIFPGMRPVGTSTVLPELQCILNAHNQLACRAWNTYVSNRIARCIAHETSLMDYSVYLRICGILVA